MGQCRRLVISYSWPTFVHNDVLPRLCDNPFRAPVDRVIFETVDIFLRQRERESRKYDSKFRECLCV